MLSYPLIPTSSLCMGTTHNAPCLPCVQTCMSTPPHQTYLLITPHQRLPVSITLHDATRSTPLA